VKSPSRHIQCSHNILEEARIVLLDREMCRRLERIFFVYCEIVILLKLGTFRFLLGKTVLIKTVSEPGAGVKSCTPALTMKAKQMSSSKRKRSNLNCSDLYYVLLKMIRNRDWKGNL
jgi:hypothetical protein